MVHCIPCEGTLQLVSYTNFHWGLLGGGSFFSMGISNFQNSHWGKVENIFFGVEFFFAWEHQKIGPQGKLRPTPKEFFFE